MVSRTIAWRIPANDMGKMEEKLPPVLLMFSAEDANDYLPVSYFKTGGHCRRYLERRTIRHGKWIC